MPDPFDTVEEGRRALAFLRHNDYRRCDIPACNCGSWHGGRLREHLDEIAGLLDEADVPVCGYILRDRVRTLIAERDREREEGASLQAKVDYLRAGLRALMESTRADGACVPACASQNGADDCDCGYMEACDADDAGAFAHGLLAHEVVLDGALRAALAPTTPKE